MLSLKLCFFIQFILFSVQFDKLGRVGDRFLILRTATGSATLILSRKPGVVAGKVDPMIEDIIVYMD